MLYNAIYIYNIHTFIYPYFCFFIPICLGKSQCGACAEVVLPAVAQNGNAFGYAARLLRNDPNIAFQAAGALQHPKKMPNRLKPGQDVN